MFCDYAKARWAGGSINIQGISCATITVSLPVGRVGFSNQWLVSFNPRGCWDDGKRSHVLFNGGPWGATLCVTGTREILMGGLEQPAVSRFIEWHELVSSWTIGSNMISVYRLPFGVVSVCSHQNALMTIDACLLFSSVEPRLSPFARAEYQPERKYVAFRFYIYMQVPDMFTHTKYTLFSKCNLLRICFEETNVLLRCFPQTCRGRLWVGFGMNVSGSNSR